MDTLPPERVVLVCQNRGCRRAGADQVFAACHKHLPVGIQLVGSACLGQCGNGPTVLVLPDQVWYCRVHPDEIPTVVEKHLLGGHPIAAMQCKAT